MNTMTGSRRVWLAVLLGSLTATAPLALDMYLPALPQLSQDLQASTSQTQLSLTFCLLGLALGQLLAGPISDACGRKLPLMAGLIIYIIATVLCALTDSIYALIGLRFIQGLAGSAGIVIARAIVRDYYSGSEMTKFFALLMLVNGVAPIAAPVIGGQLLRFTSWHGVFLLLGILGAVQLLFVLAKLSESLPEERRQTGGIRKTLDSMGSLLGDRLFMGYVCSQGLLMASMFAYISGSPFVLQDLYGLSPQAFSAVFAVNSIGLIIANQVSARMCVRFGERKMLQVALGVAAVGSVAFFMMVQSGAGLIGVLPALFVVVICVGLAGPASTSLSLQEQGHRAGSASALAGVTQMGLGASVTPIVGLAGSGTAAPLAMVILCCGVGAGLCYVWLVRGAAKRSAAETRA